MSEQEQWESLQQSGYKMITLSPDYFFLAPDNFISKPFRSVSVVIHEAAIYHADVYLPSLITA